MPSRTDGSASQTKGRYLMSLANSQIDRILNMYDSRRTRAHFELQNKRREIYVALPEIKAIEDRIIEGSVKRARLALLGDDDDLTTLADENQRLADEKVKVLTSHGYPANYLELKYTCPVCKDTGYLGGKKCSCFIKELAKLAYDDSDIRDLISRENFSTFDYDKYSDDPYYTDPQLKRTPREQISRVVEDVKKYIENFDTNGGNLYIFGDTGVGKTFLSNCIAKELIDRAYNVMYFPSYRLFEMMTAGRFGQNTDENHLGIDSIGSCDMLIIDDLGTEMPNALTEAFLYSCINERLLKRKSTIISTNLHHSRLREIYGERVYSRVIQNYTPLKIIGQDIRLE